MTKFLINGIENSCIDVSDRGFQYGDGIFETIAFKNNQLQLWELHMQRMQKACERLSLTKVSETTWLDDIKKLQPDENSVIKLSISRGISGRGYKYNKGDNVTRVAAVHPWPDYSESNFQGITAVLCKTPVSINPALAGIKHLNRLDNVLARNEWQDAEISEGFMFDNQQHVIEGTMSNLFCVLGDEIYTPLLEQSGVAGVMRETLIKLAEKMNIAVNEVDISRHNFLQMDEIFVTNSLIGIWPVNKIIDSDTEVKFSCNEVTGKLKVALADSISSKQLY